MVDEFHPGRNRANLWRGLGAVALLVFGGWTYWSTRDAACNAALPQTCTYSPSPLGSVVAGVCLVMAGVLLWRVLTRRR